MLRLGDKKIRRKSNNALLRPALSVSSLIAAKKSTELREYKSWSKANTTRLWHKLDLRLALQ
jgi:hypothetical protein